MKCCPFWSVAIMLLIGASLQAQQRASVAITRAEYGDRWPFTVDRGVLQCVQLKGSIATVTFSGYALNGTAKQLKRYRDVAAIWRSNPKSPGTKISIGPLITRGLALCT